MPARRSRSASRDSTIDDRAALYLRLATLEDAGVPALRALRTLAAEGRSPLAAAVNGTLDRLARGQALAEAGRGAALFRPWEMPLIAAGSACGQLGAVYRCLARHHERRALFLRRLRTRLLLPLVLVLLALFLAPLPALARGTLDVGGYLARSLLPIALALAAALLLRQAWRLAALRRAAPPGYGLLRRLPGCGPLLLQLQQARGLSVLSLLLAGGLPAGQALRTTGTTLHDPGLRTGCVRAAQAAERGSAVAPLLTAAGLCSAASGRALIHSGEAAGELDAAIAGYAGLMEQDLALRLDLVAEWLPRLLYLGLALPYLL